LTMSTEAVHDADHEITFDDLPEVARRAKERFDREQPEECAMVPASFAALAPRCPKPIPQVTYSPRCQGGCDAIVRWRGDWCAACRREGHRRAVAIALADAYQAVNPGGSRDWCRAGHTDFEAAMKGQPDAKPKPLPGLRWLYEQIPASARDTVTDDIVRRARWVRSLGSLVVVGPLFVGKTPFITALALGVLDAARDGKIDHQSPAFRAIAGIRYVSGYELAKAERRHALGRDEPPMITMAKRCPVLIMDEMGFGDDPEVSAVREIIRARYERADCKPVLFGSGMTIEQLNKRFGEATMKCLWARGRVVDVHQIAADVARHGSAA
jgi:hypothetical protein